MKTLFTTFFLLSAFGAFAAPETSEFDAKELKNLKLENGSGKISITATSGKATVTATKNKFGAKCKMNIEKSGSELVVKVKHEGLFSGGDCDVDFDIKLPESTDLAVKMGSGKLSVEGIKGKLDFKAGSGDILAKGSFREIEGEVGSGTVSVQGLAGGGKIKAGSGEIDLTMVGLVKGELELRTGSGSATIKLPKNSKIKTDFRAGSGQMNNELGENAKPDFKISMKAGSGNLNIRAN